MRELASANTFPKIFEEETLACHVTTTKRVNILAEGVQQESGVSTQASRSVKRVAQGRTL